MTARPFIVAVAIASLPGLLSANPGKLALATEFASLPHPLQAAFSPKTWLAERRLTDVHLHVEVWPERLDQSVSILDRAGIGEGLLLGVGTVTSSDGKPSAFAEARAAAASASDLLGDRGQVALSEKVGPVGTPAGRHTLRHLQAA